MNFAQLLAARLSRVEKIKLRMAASEDALISKYWDYRNELSGGLIRGGTTEQGLEEMREVRAICNTEFTQRSATKWMDL